MNLFGIIYALIIQLLATHTFAIPTVPIAGEYVTLSKLCKEGAEDTVSPFQTPNFQSPPTPASKYESPLPCLNSTFSLHLTTSQYVAVLFANGDRKTYKYGECYPYSIDKSKAVQAVFCKLAFCVGKSYVSSLPHSRRVPTPKLSLSPLHLLLHFFF